MFDQAKQDWINALGATDPGVRIQHRLQLKVHGSEFGYRRVFDPRRLAVSSALARTRLIGKAPSAADLTAGSRRLVIPDGWVCVAEELNYQFEEATPGPPTANISASVLALEVNGQALSRFAPFRLDAFHRGDSGLLFGVLPLRITVPPDGDLALFLTGGGGADSMNVRVSLTCRFEPLWLWKAAGLSLNDEP